MTCNEEFYAGIGHITDAYKRVCRFNEELHADLEKYRAENAKLRELATGLYRCWQGEECEGCPMQDDGGWCVRDIQLRKLGIEVSE